MGKHPSGLYVLFTTEMWERFSYYGMRAIFTLFMVKVLAFDKAFAVQVYGSYTGLVYLTPLLGGIVADNLWGNQKSIIVGGVLMAIGQFCMFLSGSFAADLSVAVPMCYLGLGFLIFGNGFFKPNISTMVGQLYDEGDKRVDSAFTIFYMGINLGAFFAPLVCGYLAEKVDYKWGFLTACIGMIIALISFILLKDKHLITPSGAAIGDKPNTVRDKNAPSEQLFDNTILDDGAFNSHQAAQAAGGAGGFSTREAVVGAVLLFGFASLFYFRLEIDLIGSFIYSACLSVPTVILMDRSLNTQERQRIMVIIIIAFFVIAFWGAFEQAGASLTFFADEQTDRNLFGFEIPATYFQSINPLAIVIFAPIFAAMWTSMGNKEPASPVKQAIGLALLCVGYIIIWFGVQHLTPGIKVSMFWLFSMYMLHTFGELCLSPIGLSMVSKLAPARFASLMMGVWFLSTATANKFAGFLSTYYPSGDAEFKKAAENGIGNLPDILKGTATATVEQLAKLKELGIAHQFPSIAGFQVTNLSDFFMIFMVMSGVSSILLLIFSRQLLKMMHGIR